MEKLLAIQKHVGKLERVVDLAEIRGNRFIAQSSNHHTPPYSANSYHKYIKKFILYSDAVKYARLIAKKENEDMDIYLYDVSEESNKLITISPLK